MEGALLITSDTSLLDGHGNSKLNLYDLVAEQGWCSDVIIATPNINASELKQLQLTKDMFRQIAGPEYLDLAVLFYGWRRGDVVVEDRWELGATNGNQTFVHIYPAEFFNVPGSWNMFAETAAFKLALR